MAYLVGVVLALAIGAFATIVGLDRDRAFYPTIMIVIALLYGLYAVLGESTQALMSESVGIVVFVSAAVIGFKRNLWIVAIALAGHGIYDFVHPALFINPGVPAWWPAFCGAYDLVAGVYLGVLLRNGRVSPSPIR
jgi:hypothetical protein